MMTSSHRNLLAEQQEASQRAQQLTQAYAQFSLRLDPINWQEDGMQAIVAVHGIEIASLWQLRQRGSDDLLRQVQIKLFERAAQETASTRKGLKAQVWSPVDVREPQSFMSLWIITLENNERIPIIEAVRDGERVYEHYPLDCRDEHRLAQLFGLMHEGEYHRGDHITLKEREREYSGEIVYILSPGKAPSGRKQPSKGFHPLAGSIYTNQAAPRYLVDCNDGFPHLVHQSQVIS